MGTIFCVSFRPISRAGELEAGDPEIAGTAFVVKRVQTIRERVLLTRSSGLDSGLRVLQSSAHTTARQRASRSQTGIRQQQNDRGSLHFSNPNTVFCRA